MTALALLLPAARDASASTVATVAARLAADTQHLADVRDDIAANRAKLRAVRAEHRRLRDEVEGRLVAIYKHGNGGGALSRMAGGESMSDVGDTLDALDHVADHDAKLLARWRKLDKQRTRLLERRKKLRVELRKAERDVRKARVQLSRAERAAEQARLEAERMARIADSPLLPKVGHPETTAVQAEEGTTEAAPSAPAEQPIGFQQSGTASMYADSFSGQMTANGEHYDPSAFTAAHPSLPFGTWVTVSGPGGSVSVRINDRGPFVGGRIIDLSRAAANAIGLPGVGQVTLGVAA